MGSKTENYKRLNVFFAKEYHSLRYYVNARIDNAADRDAEDIVQEVALKLFSRADTLSPIENVAGFVYNSLRNRIIDLMRAKKIRTHPDDEMENKFMEFVELFYGPTDNAYPERLRNELKKAILNLKSDYRNIVLAIDFEGYTYREIAEDTGVPIGTLMSRRHRALSLLAKELENKKTI